MRQGRQLQHPFGAAPYLQGMSLQEMPPGENVFLCCLWRPVYYSTASQFGMPVIDS